MCLFTDPPFGCRTEALAFTLKTISRRYQRINSTNNILPIMWIFPYFMEVYIRNEMPEMEMSDYKVNYTNHKLYHDGAGSRKQGSPIRIFTNIPLNDIDLSSTTDNGAYRWCPECRQWRSSENRHCVKCDTCPSKNGVSYVHCQRCEQCVKPNYNHCPKCNRCTQVTDHNCTDYQKHVSCLICAGRGHTEMKCRKWLKRCRQKNLPLKGASGSIGDRQCLLCNRTGHNERACRQRRKVLKEYQFLGVNYNVFSW